MYLLLKITETTNNSETIWKSKISQTNISVNTKNQTLQKIWKSEIYQINHKKTTRYFFIFNLS